LSLGAHLPLESKLLPSELAICEESKGSGRRRSSENAWVTS